VRLLRYFLPSEVSFSSNNESNLMSAYIPSIVIGTSSTILLVLLVCAVNLVLRYIREAPVTEYDRAVLKLAAVFVVVELAGWAWVAR
jgi:predicted acyltransferase